MKTKTIKTQSGQILLITLLIMSIATTVALSLVSRTTTDVNISSQFEESSRAFNAAEAGVELALKNASGTSGSTGTDATYSVNVADVGNTQTFIFRDKTIQGTTESVWLVNHDANGNPVIATTYTANFIDVCWSNETTIPAVSITIFYRKGGIYYTAKEAFDPVAARRNGATPYTVANNFSALTSSVLDGCGTTTMYKQTLDLRDYGFTPSSNPAISLRIRPIYSDATIGVKAAAGSTLPKQGSTIVSTGSTTTGMTRKIIVSQSYRAPSTIFDAGIVSYGSFGHL